MQRAGQLDFVVAVLGRDRQRIDRPEGRRPGGRGRAVAAVGQQIAGPDPVHPAQRRDPAGFRRLALGLLAAHQRQQAADPLAVQRHAFGHPAGENPGQRKLAGVLGVIGLEDLSEGGVGIADAQARLRDIAPGHLVAQRLEQPPDAEIPLGRSDHDRNDVARPYALGQESIDLVNIGDIVLQQALEQAVIEVGQRFEHLAPGELVVIGQLGGDVDHRRALAGGVSVGAAADQIDIAG